MSLVSFIIPAHNEEACLPRTLQAIHSAATELGIAYEIVVTDDASTDRTAEVAREFGARVAPSDRRQIAAARNIGAAKAKGEVFIFVDADTAVRTQTVRAALAAIEDGAVGGGSAVRFDGEIPIWSRILLPVLIGLWLFTRWAAGCFLFCRREAFEAVGGFDERYFASEEIWISKALKREGRFVVLREHVVTSGRKLRQFTGLQILWTFLKICARGPWGTRRRKGLELWYDAPRETEIPVVPAEPPSTP